jgi:hypothetical protein
MSSSLLTADAAMSQCVPVDRGLTEGDEAEDDEDAGTVG